MEGVLEGVTNSVLEGMEKACQRVSYCNADKDIVELELGVVLVLELERKLKLILD